MRYTNRRILYSTLLSSDLLAQSARLKLQALPCVQRPRGLTLVRRDKGNSTSSPETQRRRTETVWSRRSRHTREVR